MTTLDHDTVRAMRAWDHELATTGRVTLRPSRDKMILALLGTLAFTAIGLVMILMPDAPWAVRIVGVVAVGFFGVIGIPSLIRQFVLAGAPVVIDAAGIHIPRQVDLPWHELRSVGVFNVRRTRIVTLGVDDAFLQEWLAHRSRATRWLAAGNRTLTRDDAFALPGTLRVDVEALVHWIGEQAAHRQGTHVSLD